MALRLYLGKPASRSSSFTIAERKKSFEALTNRQSDISGSRHGSKPADSRLSSGHQLHSSQDSLANMRMGATSLMHSATSKSYSCVSSRRSSRDEISSASSLTFIQATPRSATTSSNLVTSKTSSTSMLKTPEIDTNTQTKTSTCTNEGNTDLVASHKSAVKVVSRTNSTTRSQKSSPTKKETKGEIFSNDPSKRSSISSQVDSKVIDDSKKRSTMDKKWSSTLEKTGSKITVVQSSEAKNKISQFAVSMEKNDNTKMTERPRDLSFASSLTGKEKIKMSPVSVPVTPCTKNIKEMANRWEERSGSMDLSSVITPANLSIASTPIPHQSFSRRSTQDTFSPSSSVASTQNGVHLNVSQVKTLVSYSKDRSENFVTYIRYMHYT